MLPSAQYSLSPLQEQRNKDATDREVREELTTSTCHETVCTHTDRGRQDQCATVTPSFGLRHRASVEGNYPGMETITGLVDPSVYQKISGLAEPLNKPRLGFFQTAVYTIIHISLLHLVHLQSEQRPYGTHNSLSRLTIQKVTSLETGAVLDEHVTSVPQYANPCSLNRSRDYKSVFP
jgi:hypothetical protein